MPDTVETLRADLDALTLQLNEFIAYAKPVIDGHQLLPQSKAAMTPLELTRFAAVPSGVARPA